MSKTNVLLVGATGTLGQHLLNGLTDPLYNKDFNVFALIRPETVQSNDEKKVKQLTDIKAKGVTVVEGDINDAESKLTHLLNNHNIHVVLSAVTHPHFESQINLLQAATAASTVQLFIPSEFGLEIRATGYNSPVPLFDPKLKVREAVEKSGLNYLIIVSGFFIEYLLSPFTGVDVQNHTITAPGGTDKQVTTTALRNVGLNTAALIKDKSIRNQVVLLGDATVSYAELKQLLEETTGQQFKQIIRSKEELEAAIQANPHDFVARFALVFLNQKGTHWSLDNAYRKHSMTIQETAKLLLRH